MAKITIVLDEEQVMRLEQVLIDRESEGAFKLLQQIRAKVKGLADTQCGVEKIVK